MYWAIMFGIFLAMLLVLIVTLGEELWLNLHDYLIAIGRKEE